MRGHRGVEVLQRYQRLVALVDRAVPQAPTLSGVGCPQWTDSKMADVGVFPTGRFSREKEHHRLTQQSLTEGRIALDPALRRLTGESVHSGR